MATLSRSIPADRMAVLFAVMLVAAAGNTAMQSILPAIGAKLDIPDVWVSLAFSWSALLWVMTAPYWARQSDKRGRKALMALGVIGEYLGRVFNESKGRPLYFVADYAPARVEADEPARTA